MNNVKREVDLYEGMCEWLRIYLKDKYKKSNCQIYVIDSHSVALDSVLEQYHIIQYFPQVVGLNIEIDVLGIVKWDNRANIYFIEAKKTPLSLHHLGQLLIYCKLCNPEEAYLLSSSGLGGLNKILNIHKREDLLDFGTGKRIKKIKVAKWDVIRKTIDNHSIIPRI